VPAALRRQGDLLQSAACTEASSRAPRRLGLLGRLPWQPDLVRDTACVQVSPGDRACGGVSPCLYTVLCVYCLDRRACTISLLGLSIG
jgi:hypothetical protein